MGIHTKQKEVEVGDSHFPFPTLGLPIRTHIASTSVMKKLLLLLGILSTLVACQPSPTAVENQPLFTTIPSPAKEGGESNLFVAEDGTVYLSWLSYLNDSTDVLLFSTLHENKWTTPLEIARGSDWFVNWADFPSMAVFQGSNEHLAAHWLQKSAAGVYDYDVRIALSDDGGAHWGPSFIPHTDGIPAEHGFVSLLPLANERIFAVWLDGRHTKVGKTASDGDHSHSHAGGAMTLRTAEFDRNGQLFEEAELDPRICDCCQTDAALTPAGPIVVYRDRSPEEIRDIYVVRKVNGQWTSPQAVAKDQWEIAGCPVNGPAIATLGQQVAVAWFTGAEGKSQVKMAFSNDRGETFAEPILIDDGQPLGRVDIVFTGQGKALVSWIEQVGEGGELRLARVDAAGKMGESITATPIGISRQSGFPILKEYNGKYLLAWTSGVETTSVSTMMISL